MRRLDRDRVPLQIPHFIGGLLAEDGIDATGEMGSTGDGSLVVMLAMGHHLCVVDPGKTDVVLTGDEGIHVEGRLDEIGTCLGDVTALGVVLTALV